MCKELSAVQQPTREHTESVQSVAVIKVTLTQSAGSGAVRMQCGLNKQLQNQNIQSVGWLVGQSVSWSVSRLVFDWDLIGTQRGGNGCKATLDTGGG